MSHVITTKKNKALQLNNEYLNNPKLSLFEAAECKENCGYIKGNSSTELITEIKLALKAGGFACACTDFSKCIWSLIFDKFIWILRVKFNEEPISYIYTHIRNLINLISSYDNLVAGHYRDALRNPQYGDYPAGDCSGENSPWSFEGILNKKYCQECGGGNGKRKKGKRNWIF